MARIRRWLVTGLIVLVPLAITIWVLDLVLSTMDKALQLLPPSAHPDKLLGFHIPYLGAVLVVIVVLVVGGLASNLIGAKLVQWWEELLGRIPIVRSVYNSVKQVSDTILSPNGQAFRQAVLVEFPRSGAWSVGFVVGTPGDEISQVLKTAPLSVFVPTAPNPTSGYIIIVSPDQITDLNMSVDEALKFIVSLGVVVPGKNGVATLENSAQVQKPQ
ncbi:MAG: DUF502 domain-containing protein [Burkholderiaceae bacterium]